MVSQSKYSQLKEKFQNFGQDHVFNFFDSLSDDEKAKLIADLEKINLEEMQTLHKRLKAERETPQRSPQVTPFPDVCSLEESQLHQEEWRDIGFEKISQGKVAVLLLAGGQGTRLGTKKPKGMYDIGLPSHKSLFELQAERLLRIQMLAKSKTGVENVVIPWYIMTSDATNQETMDFFQNHDFFGLNKENIFFFEQEMLPCITPEGKIIMETKSKVARAPNGNGGLYHALNVSGALKDMEERGIEMVFQYGVDNCLVLMSDPTFVGFCFDKEIDCSAKVVTKAYPEEPVGVMCLKDGAPAVIEYSEIDTDMANQRAANGKLLYGDAHLCMNMFSFNFLKSISKSPEMLPYHIAEKKIPTIDEQGNPFKPEKTNGWKLELFVFDVFPAAKKMNAFEVKREKEFSPLKNAPGSAKDCPETCRKHLSELHMSYIKNAGGTIENPEDHPEKICEISPLLSLEGEGLDSVRGKSYKLPVVLGLNDTGKRRKLNH